MKAKFILLFLLASICGFGQKDPAAEPMLNKIAQDLDPGHALKIDFEYIREDLQSETELTGEGSLILMGEKYKIDLGEAIIWFDGETQYSLNLDIEEVYISNPDPENKEFIFSDPIRLLRNYKESFKYRLMGDVSYRGFPAREVQLYPEELGGPYALIKLFFTPSKSELKAIFIRQKEGILYTMLVSEIDKKEDIDEEFFQFSENEFPNVDVIELLD